MKLELNALSIFPIFIFSLTTMITFSLSIYYKHIDSLLTTISQTGNKPPESYIFTFGCCLSSFCLFVNLYLIDLIFEKTQNEMKLKNEFVYLLRDFTFYIGVAGCISFAGLGIVSWDQNAPIHGGFTVIMFLGTCLHGISSTIVQIYLKMKNLIKIKIFISMVSLILMLTLFYFHWKEGDWKNWKFYFTSRSILETTTIYSLFSYSVCYYSDFNNFQFNLVEANKEDKNE
jgi:hypothetical protein